MSPLPDPVMIRDAPTVDVAAMIRHCDKILDLMPFRDDVEAGSQTVRDLLKVRDCILRAKTQLNTTARR